MEELAPNMQKYYNYKEQNERLNKALKNQFYLEAIFIEYVILEDRTESILRYTGHYEKLKKNPNDFISIDKKLKKIEEIAREKQSIANKYFTENFIQSIKDWKEKRNKYMHALMKNALTIDELKQLAEDGQILVKNMCRLSANYKRALVKANILV